MHGITLTKGTDKWRDNEDHKEEVISLAKEGKTATEISRETGINYKTVQRWCEKADVILTKGVSKGSRKIDEKVKKEVLRLIEEGKTVKEVERSTGVSEVSIRRWCVKARNTLYNRFK